MHRILIVEDEQDIADLIGFNLQRAGFEVFKAHDGIAGTETALRERPDLIVLDLMLPEKDGFQVLREFRQRNSTVPVLILPARSLETDLIQGFDLGADDYMTKPFSPRELRARVRALIRRAAPDAEPTQRFGDCEVDFSRAELRRSGVATDLTAIELKMLQLFLRQPGRVLSRAQVIGDVWGPDVFVTDRVVDTHVVKLRRKVESDPGDPKHIVSVRGLGYRFER